MSITTIQKTDTSKSPLLQPVISRDYTKGLSGQSSGPGPGPEPVKPVDTQGQATNIVSDQNQAGGPGPKPGAAPDFSSFPDDKTKEFSFEEPVNETASDLGEGEAAPGVNIPTGSARTFANFVGNAIQIYLPKATYSYVKIDMNNVRMNVEKGNLTLNWIEAFEKMNEQAEEALKIPDENMKMWKAAFQHYLEYKQVTFANPETEFWAATALLLGNQGVRTYQLKKTMEGYMAEAIAASNAILFERSGANQDLNNTQTSKTAKDGDKVAA